MSRFVIDCERMKYPNTGLYTYCSELGQTLLKQATPEEEFFLYLPDHTNSLLETQPHYRQRSWHKFWMPYSKSIDVWHTTYQTSNYQPASSRTKKVLTIHDLNFLYETNNIAKTNRLLTQIQRKVNKSDHLVAISNYVKADIMEHLDTRDKPLSVIYNGCNIQSFPSFDQPIYRPERPFLFSLGTVLPKKNFHVIPCLLQNNDYELLIAGNINQAYAKLILQEAAQYKAQERVKIMGPIDEKNKYWYLHHCAAFVFPSLAEGFGIPVIEAMHHGKPVFLSNKTSLPEIGGNMAYYFENFDPIYMQEIFRKGMDYYTQYQPANTIRKHADSFKWEDIAAQYLHVYRSLIG